MIRLNKLTDYAVVLLSELAFSRDVLNAAALARRTGIPQPTVSKLLKILSQKGLVTAQRGRAGGYGLGRDAERINLAEIVAAVEGPMALTACVDGVHEGCDFERSCPINGRWDRINRVIVRALEGMTLGELALTAPRPAAPPTAAAHPQP